jgi:hypothetical protein
MAGSPAFRSQVSSVFEFEQATSLVSDAPARLHFMCPTFLYFKFYVCYFCAHLEQEVNSFDA